MPHLSTPIYTYLQLREVHGLGLRALLAVQLRMAAHTSRVAFGRPFGGMLGGQCESVPVGWGLGEGAPGPET